MHYIRSGMFSVKIPQGTPLWGAEGGGGGADLIFGGKRIKIWRGARE